MTRPCDSGVAPGTTPPGSLCALTYRAVRGATGNAYEDGQEQGANWFTQYAVGVLGQHERDKTSDRIVAERVYEMAAAQAVGEFILRGAQGPTS